jgi:hypothetical protein
MVAIDLAVSYRARMERNAVLLGLFHRRHAVALLLSRRRRRLLQVYHPRVHAAFLPAADELDVRAVLHHAVRDEHRDRVGLAERGEPVRHDDGGPVRPAHRALRLGVQCAGRLIEEQDLGVTDEGECCGDALLLPSGQLRPKLPNLRRTNKREHCHYTNRNILWPELRIVTYIGFVSMGQFVDGHLRRHDNLLKGHRPVAEQYVLPDGRGE